MKELGEWWGCGMIKEWVIDDDCQVFGLRNLKEDSVVH